MTTPEQLTETVRTYLSWVPPDHAKDAHSALASLLAAYEESERERADFEASQAELLRQLEAMREERDEALRALADPNGPMGMMTTLRVEAAEREVERLRHESGALENEGRRLREVLWEVRMQATRKDRATDEHVYLLTDLKIIERRVSAALGSESE